MPSASAATSRSRIAAQARPVLPRSRFSENTTTTTLAPSSVKYQCTGCTSSQPKKFGKSSMIPVEKPRRVSYSPPAKTTMKCSARVLMAR